MSAPAADPQRAALERALGAQYEIGRLLGQGGMGAVYLARERNLERDVAIKVLPPDLASGAESRERFRREARTAARLTHPNIVPLHTFGDAEGMLYFVMGYVRGESLGDRMRREGRLGEADVRRILAELADALDYAHRQGVIHRDIKPDNVLLDDESGRPMLTDFGVARARATGATLTEAGAVVGTAHYMSPEQASGARDLDGRSDLYALGVMGYAMLSGRLPFEGETFRDVIVQQVSQAAPPLTAMAPGVPPDLVALVARCMEKDPARRWPDGRAMAAALGEAGDDEDTRRPLSIEGSGTVVGHVWAISAVLAIITRTTRILSGPPWWVFPLVIAAVPAVPIGIVALIERWRGDSWRTIVDRLMIQSRSWPFWWPRRWRRPGDVYDRLPAVLKRVRWAAAASLPAFVIEGVLFAISWDRWSRELIPPRWFTPVLITGFVAGYGLFMSAIVYARRWARRHGISGNDGARAALAPTGGLAFWRKPKFAALLAGTATRVAAGEPHSPADFVRAIADAAAQLSGPVRETGSVALQSARQLQAAIDAMDAEIIQLARDASPAELAQVEQKLAALGAAASDHDARRKMRALLEGQRDLLGGLAAQLGDANERRAHLADLLRTLWLQVASLRAEGAQEALRDSEITGQIRAVCDEVARQAKAVAETRVIAPGKRLSEPRASPVLGIAARLALLAFFTMEAVRQLRSHDFEFSVFGGIIFGVHELGHLVFMPFGELMTIAGGSISQLLLPIAAIALFAVRKDRYAIAVCGCWLAISLGQLAVYIADARAESLDLVSFSPEGGGHDWNYLLERFNLLRQDVALGHFTRFVGWVVLALSWLFALDAMQKLARGTPAVEAS